MTAGEDFGGIIKLYDGIYIAEEFGARDIESILMNHITHVVNCTVDHVPNYFQKDGVQYFPFRYNESSSDLVMLDNHDKTITEVFAFIQEAREQGESILIHGWKEYTLPLVFFAAYLMIKYRWALSKSLQFLERRIGVLPIRGTLISQLKGLESRYKNKIRSDLSTEWKLSLGANVEQITIHNTYINAMGMYKPVTSSYQSLQKTESSKRVSWRETITRNSACKPRTKPKSILKVSGREEMAKPIKSEKTSASQSIIRDKQGKVNSSLDNKSFKLIKDRIQDKLRTTIQLFKPKGQEQNQKSRLKSEPAQDDQKRPLNNLTNIQRMPRPSNSDHLSLKKSIHIQQRTHTNTDQNLDHPPFDLTKQMVRKIVFDNNTNPPVPNKDQDNLKSNCDISLIRESRDFRGPRQQRDKPVINNFINESKPYSKPESPAQKPQKPQRTKLDLKLKTQFRGFSPMLKQGKKIRDLDAMVSTKMFMDGPRRAWK